MFSSPVHAPGMKYYTHLIILIVASSCLFCYYLCAPEVTDIVFWLGVCFYMCTTHEGVFCYKQPNNPLITSWSINSPSSSVSHIHYTAPCPTLLHRCPQGGCGGEWEAGAAVSCCSDERRGIICIIIQPMVDVTATQVCRRPHNPYTVARFPRKNQRQMDSRAALAVSPI